MTTNFEAKLHGFRRTQDGVVVSYVVHPSDVSAELATAALGTRYMVAVAEIGDDELPREPETGNGKPDLKALGDKLEKQPLSEGEQPDGSYKYRRPFASLPLSQQCAMRCQDRQFQQFMVERYAGHIPYKPTPENAAVMVREYCRVDSRSKIIEGDKSADYWLDLDARYQHWLTDRQYAGAVR